MIIHGLLILTKHFQKNFKPKSYDCHDYIDTWFYTFFYRPFDDSWFFHWGNEIKNQNDFPNWFLTIIPIKILGNKKILILFK